MSLCGKAANVDLSNPLQTLKVLSPAYQIITCATVILCNVGVLYLNLYLVLLTHIEKLNYPLIKMLVLSNKCKISRCSLDSALDQNSFFVQLHNEFCCTYSCLEVKWRTFLNIFLFRKLIISTNISGKLKAHKANAEWFPRLMHWSRNAHTPTMSPECYQGSWSERS